MLGVDVSSHYALPAALFLVFTGFLAVATFPTISLKGFTIPSRFQSLIFFSIASVFYL